jgi:hypothetical protein
MEVMTMSTKTDSAIGQAVDLLLSLPDKANLLSNPTLFVFQLKSMLEHELKEFHGNHDMNDRVWGNQSSRLETRIRQLSELENEISQFNPISNNMPKINIRGTNKELASLLNCMESEHHVDHLEDKEVAFLFTLKGKTVNPSSLKSIRSRDL